MGGLGLPWTVGAIYWSVKGPDEGWVADYPVQAAAWAPGAILVVESGSLATSVLVFASCAVVCMGLLLLRRLFAGGELGGPRWLKYCSSVFLVLLWLVYISISSWQIMKN